MTQRDVQQKFSMTGLDDRVTRNWRSSCSLETLVGSSMLRPLKIIAMTQHDVRQTSDITLLSFQHDLGNQTLTQHDGQRKTGHHPHPASPVLCITILP